MFLCGARLVHTCDILPLVKMPRLRTVIRRFIEYAERGELNSLLPELPPERVALLSDAYANPQYTKPAELLQALSINLLVCNARQTGLPAEKVDLLISTEVLMHIPRQILVEIFQEFRRIAKPTGIMNHLIDMTDQYSYFDSSITPYHFLRFSSRAWRLIDNSIVPMNRLRLPDYRSLVEQAGFCVVTEENNSGKPEDLQRVSITNEFQHYTVEELLVLRSWLKAQSQLAYSIVQCEQIHA